jgi:predicted RecB family nuclease
LPGWTEDICMSPKIDLIDDLLPPLEAGKRYLQPSALGRFISYDQCQRLFRLDLYQRETRNALFSATDTRPELLPPSLSESGESWEISVEEGLRTAGRLVSNLAGSSKPGLALQIMITEEGRRRIVLQSHLNGVLDGWKIDAKPDLVLIDKTGDRLQLLIADLKSSRSVRLEHRLQVALYAMVAAQIFPDAEITQAVLYREPVSPIDQWTDEEQAHKASAKDVLNLDSGALLAIAEQPEIYQEQVERTILRPTSLANRIAAERFSRLPFHLAAKCDGCQYNEFCLSCAREAGDLSLIPHMTERNKRLIQAEGIRTVEDLRTVTERNPEARDRLVTTPSLGYQLNSLIRRADAYNQWQTGQKVDTRLPERGYSSLPATSLDLHPNLIRVFLDVQRDPTQGRVYMLGALVSCLKDGSEASAREKTVVKLAGQPILNDQQEAALVIEWIREVLLAVHSCQQADPEGNDLAPIHFYVWDNQQINVFKDLVNRQHDAVLGIEAIMALMMQPAAFDTSNISIVFEEVESQRALPMLCQSLQAVASYFRFPWPEETRSRFHYRVFDALEREGDDGHGQIVPSRSRFRSEIPTEYAFRAWGIDSEVAPVLDDEPKGNSWALYSHPTIDEIRTFQEQRVAALKFVAGQLATNRQTSKSVFDLQDLRQFSLRPERPIEAVREFLAVERHIELSEWRRIHSLSIDSRVKLGETLIARYHESDQSIDVRLAMREARRKEAAKAELGESYHELSKEEQKPFRYSLGDLEVKLRIAQEDLPFPLAEALLLTQRREGDFVVVAPAESVDTRPEAKDRAPFQTTAKQLLRMSGRAVIDKLTAEGTLIVRLKGSGAHYEGFVWGPYPKPFDDGSMITIDDDPDSWPMCRQWQVVEEIRQGRQHAGYEWLASGLRPLPMWDKSESAAQARFMAGLDRFGDLDPEPSRYEPQKHEFIGQHGDKAMMLVQGPPGTGKSTTTGWAIWARIQGALASGREYRIGVSCHTHAATNVLVGAILKAQSRLTEIASQNPDFFEEYFDHRLLEVPVFRFEPNDPEEVPHGTTRFERKTTSAKLNEIRGYRQAIVGATTLGLGKLCRQASGGGVADWDLLVLDEASQMSVPAFLVASVGLKRDGRIIVVGDHRQMPPIVRQDRVEGDVEPLDPYAMYRSMFDVVRFDKRDRVDIKFEESFRIHRDVAEYLRREVYVQDGIDFHSRRLETHVEGISESFAGSVLGAPQPLILVVHSESRSQQRNLLEQVLAARILVKLDELEGECSAGVVVPHRAQRADLRREIIQRTGKDSLAESVDTVERFQGGERQVIIYSATESDPAYLRDTASFLFDPRRLTVAISRARAKLIVIASESVFDFLPADETALRDSAIWRNLREKACTIPIWSGEIEGHHVSVWGNPPLAADRPAEE